MKKIISLLISILLCAAALTGCGLFEHNNQRDYSQVIATIGAMEYKVIENVRDERVVGTMEKRNADGTPVYAVEVIYNQDTKQEDVWITDQIALEEKKYEYTSKEVTIYKSQLVNYVNNYGSQFIQQKETVEAQKEAIEDGVNQILDMLIATELVLAEADKHFYVGNLYWTEADVKEIQRKVYDAIDEQILTYMNVVLERNGEPLIEVASNQEQAAAETTYPIMPAEDEEEEESPRYYRDAAPFNRKLITGTEELNWFDAWYTDSEWYIKEDKYRVSYPGMYGSAKEKSLAREALNSYLAEMFENSEYIISITDEQKEIVKGERERLTEIQKNKGVEYVYPELGKTLMFKLLIGNTYLKSYKNEKLQKFIGNSVTVTSDEVLEVYNAKLKEQKSSFATQSNYDAAVSGSDIILYTPSDRHYWVKHILLPFSAEQTAELKEIQANEGKTDTEKGNEEEILRQRARLVDEIIVYPHENGEDVKTRPTPASVVVSEVNAAMARYRNSPYEAEREFNRLIYKYNTDPGIFNNDKGYSIIKENPNGEDENDYMPEFTEGAWQFRRDGYKVGQVLNDYVVTDYGIHIMYYASDPYYTDVAQQKNLNDYTTPGRYKSIYKTIEEEIYTAKSSNAYTVWENKFISLNKDKYAVIKDKLVEKYVKDLNKQLLG